MAPTNTRETDVHDLSLGVIHALAMLDVKVLSYVQLRRLNAALLRAGDVVAKETAVRAEGDNSGDTVRVQTPNLSN